MHTTQGWRPTHVGKLILDRATVRPGDALSVAGFVQEHDGKGVSARACV